jgi:4-azaleucine resistance transporter AzlC
MAGPVETTAGYPAGIRAGLPFALATLVLGASFGVLAEPLMGPVAPIVMSIVVFAGSAQFAALSVLAAGGGAVPAIAAGLLMNARFLPMGLAFGPSLRGGPLTRALQGQAVVDASFAIGNRGDGRFDHRVVIGATLPQAVGWVGGTAIGVLGGALIAEPERYGLDAVFPAFYLALLFGEAHGRRALAAAALGAAIALALLPVAPPGVPVIAAAAAALIGLRRA